MAVTALGSPVGQTTSTTQNVSGYARPVVDTVIQRSMDLSNKPYEAYTGPRVAGLSDLQQQALGGIAGLQAYTPQQFTSQSWTDPGRQQQFMDPYQQGVTDIAKREAQRTADINATQTGAQAVNRGAFGGYRHGVVEAENARNTQQLLNDIQTKGLQSAYQSGMGQFNTQNAQDFQRQYAQELANRAGYQTGISALGTQLAAGSLPQELQQRQYDVGYQDFLTKQQYPYKQIGFLQQSLSGLPITASTTALSYDKPNPLSQAAGFVGALGSMYNSNPNMFKGIASNVSDWFGGGNSGMPSSGEMAGYTQDAMNNISSGAAGM
jgi:hypothetical protein